MTNITHEGIRQRVLELEEEKDAAVKIILEKLKAERESLQEACSALGHLWHLWSSGSDYHWNRAERRFQWVCVACEKTKKRDAG